MMAHDVNNWCSHVANEKKTEKQIRQGLEEQRI